MVVMWATILLAACLSQVAPDLSKALASVVGVVAFVWYVILRCKRALAEDRAARAANEAS
jgi:uncharacterized protein involved in response to NO